MSNAEYKWINSAPKPIPKQSQNLSRNRSQKPSRNRSQNRFRTNPKINPRPIPKLIPKPPPKPIPKTNLQTEWPSGLWSEDLTCRSSGWLNYLFQKAYKWTLCPSPDRASSAVLRPSLRSSQSFRRRDCNWTVVRLTRFLGGCLRAAWSMAVLAILSSSCIEETRAYSEWCAWPTNFENPLFQASHKLLVLEVWDNVASWTFQSAGE